MPNAIVTSIAPIMLAGGRTAAPGEEVDATPETDPDHFASGALTPLDVDLTTLTRDELNELAVRAGVEDPQKLPNKDAVVAAIHDAADQPKDD